jgi:cell wall-associated NlpC family hydrolase
MLRLRILITVCAFALLLSPPAQAASRASARLALGERVAKFARSFVGVPYVWGGMSPRGFDCSGLVAFVYRHFGISLPHYTVAQFARGQRVGRWGLQPGDLVFFAGLSHVGLYVGHDEFIHAPHSGTRVSIAPLSGGYAAAFAGARRIGLVVRGTVRARPHSGPHRLWEKRASR